MESTVARSLWQVYESYHQLCYFAPEARAATDRLGLKGGWMGYFAARAAPLGPVPAELVIATFYNFHP
jgi:helix-turn-helix protein